ncbi:MAG: hypothetical protein R2706_09165 [Acidimicrobiales bacterium]
MRFPLFATPVSAAVAELLAALTARTNAVTARDAQRIERLTRLEDVLRGSADQDRSPGRQSGGDRGCDIFDVDRVTVVLRDATGDLIPVSIGPPSPKAPDSDTAALVSQTIGGQEPILVPTGYNGTMLVLPSRRLRRQQGCARVSGADRRPVVHARSGSAVRRAGRYRHRASFSKSTSYRRRVPATNSPVSATAAMPRRSSGHFRLATP